MNEQKQFRIILRTVILNPHPHIIKQYKIFNASDSGIFVFTINKNRSSVRPVNFVWSVKAGKCFKFLPKANSQYMRHS